MIDEQSAIVYLVWFCFTAVWGTIINIQSDQLSLH